MSINRLAKPVIALALITALASCSGGFRGMFSGEGRAAEQPVGATELHAGSSYRDGRRETLWDLFTNSHESNTTLEVNRYIWNAALEVLDFLPVESVDPFSGVIVTGFGTPPGGGRPYRATVHVTDPALDARSLNVALVTRAGPASPETVRAVENAILTRARQLRIRDRGL